MHLLKYDNLHDRPQVKLLDEMTVRKTAQSSTSDLVEAVEKMCRILIAQPDPMIVPVYAFQIDKAPTGTGGYFEYHYDMLRLGMLSQEEKTLVDYLAYPNSIYASYIAQESEHYPALVVFMKEMLRQGRYNDRHSGNVLKDEDGHYLIIDLEGFMHYPPEDKANDWFRKE